VTFDPNNVTDEFAIDEALEAPCGRHLLVGEVQIARFLNRRPILVQRLLEASRVARAWRRASTGEWVAYRPTIIEGDDLAA
jgi:hypothetical protein